jgi:multidrug efflux pump subunit AcrA (membrane-fusion protein)
VERTLRVAGSIAALRSATFVAPRLRGSRGRPVAGDFRMVLHQLAPSGSRVKAGDIVAQFDPQYMASRLDDLRADVVDRMLINRRLDSSTVIRRESLEQRITAARANLAKADLNLKTIPVRSAIQAERFSIARDEAQARLDNLVLQRRLFDESERSQLRREQLQLQDVQLDLERAEANLDRMVHRSPIDGVVVTGHIQRGTEMAEIQAGDEVRAGHAFLQVVDMRSLYLAGVANQVDEQVVVPGLKARIHLDAVPEVEIPGRVVAVGALASGTRYRPDWVRGIAVQVVPDRVDPRVFPNFSASADLVLAEERADAVLPRECLQPSGHGTLLALVPGPDDGESQTWVGREVRAELVGNTTAIIRDGLRTGDVVACGVP